MRELCEWRRRLPNKCHASWLIAYKEFRFFCEVCYDTNFCTACLDKVKSSSLEERHCNPEHCWFQAWPILVDIDDDGVTSDSPGGHPGLTSEWLDALRKQWLND